MPAEFALDKRRIRTNFARAANRYEMAAVLSREVCSRMLERLDLVRLDPAHVLDAGSGTGLAARSLAQRYPHAQITRVDLSLPMLQVEQRAASWAGALRGIFGRTAGAAVCADFERLPIRNAAMDLVVSNLALHWSSAPELTLAELQRVLRRGGLLMFSTLGPDSLAELREAAGEQRVHEFADMHDLGDMLVAAGFAAPVMEAERVTLLYADGAALLADLRASGQTCALAVRTGQPRRGLAGRAFLATLQERLTAQRRDGKLPVSYEVVYGHAWKAAPKRTADGRSVVKIF